MADLDLDIGSAQGIMDDDMFAVPAGTAFQQSESHPVPDRRRKSRRGDVALIVRGHRRNAKRYQVSTGAQPFAAKRANADQGRAIRIRQARPAGHDAADEVFLRRQHAAHPQIAGSRLAIQLVASGMTLFDPHDAECFGPIRNDIEGIAGVEKRADKVIAN
jgi:hypothetical protein